MASNLDKTNELLDFMHAKVHSFYRSSVLLWFVHEIICSSLKGKLFASFFCHLLTGDRKFRFSLFPVLIKNATWNNAIFKFVK